MKSHSLDDSNPPGVVIDSHKFQDTLSVSAGAGFDF